MNDPNDNKSAPQPAESPRQPGWRSALLLAAILTLVGAGAATLAGFGARHGWQLELFCHFRVQYFWALALACTGFAVLGRRVLMLVAAALAAANLVLILPLYFGPDATANDSTTLRALELNVHFLNQNYDATLDLIRRDKPDIVVLCEITPGWKEALKALDKEYPYSEIIPSRSPAGLALLSRYQITDIAVKTLSRVGLPTIVAGLETPDGRLTVIATHPASPSTATDFKYRNEQLAEVGRIAGERRAGDGAGRLEHDRLVAIFPGHARGFRTRGQPAGIRRRGHLAVAAIAATDSDRSLPGFTRGVGGRVPRGAVSGLGSSADCRGLCVLGGVLSCPVLRGSRCAECSCAVLLDSVARERQNA